MRTYNSKVETSLWHCTIGICTGCHYYGCRRGEACMKQLIKDAYQAHLSDERDLENQLRKIKEQNAEIDILIRKKDKLQDEIAELQAKNERLTAIVEAAEDYLNPLSFKNAYDEAIDKAKSEAIKEFVELVNPIIEEIVDIMFDDNRSKCMIKNCHKHSSIPCESRICIDENKAFWTLKIYNLVKEMTVNYKSSKNEEEKNDFKE